MVSDSNGVGFDHFRGPSLVESNRRRSDADLDHRLVRGDNGRAGNHFWVSLAQVACSRGRIKYDFSSKWWVRGRVGCSRFAKAASCLRVLSATKCLGGGLLKEIRLNTVDRPISVRRWNMSIPISRSEFSTGKRNL